MTKVMARTATTAKIASDLVEADIAAAYDHHAAGHLFLVAKE